MIPQKKPMEIVRENGSYRCVKLNRKYYCVGYDAARDVTYAIISHDKIVGELRTHPGYSHAAVEYVAKGRKRDTAIAYFNGFLRAQKRLGLLKQSQSVVGNDTDKTQSICSWCNGSGQDPRNLEWSCAKC